MSKITFVPDVEVKKDFLTDSYKVVISFEIPDWFTVTERWAEAEDVLIHLKEGHPITLDTEVVKEEEDVIVEKHSALQQAEEEARKSDPQWATW
jgi:hypothetical protein